MTVDLFDLTDLPSYLQVPSVDGETATRVRRIASGWLLDATGLTDFPSPVPDRLWAWGLELAAIAFRNPTSAASESQDDFSISHGDADRRKVILAAARQAYNSGSQIPQFSFPAADWHWDSTVTTTAIGEILIN